MPITLNGTTGIGTPGVASTDAITGTTGTFSGNVTANGLSTELRPLVLGTAQVSTSGTAIDFTGIPSWAKRVTVLFSGVSASGTSPIIVQLGTSGGVVTSGYVGAQGATAATAAGTTNITNGLGVYSVAAATDTFAGKAEFCLLSGNLWVGSSVVAANSVRTTFAGTTVTLSGILDRIRVTTVNGTDTFDAGTINIMWE